MTRKIKIFLIISSLGHGGAQRVITYIASYLKKEKYEISLILYEKKGEFLVELPEHIHIYDLRKRTPWDFIRLILSTRKVIKKGNPDIVLSFLFYTNIVTGLAVLFLNRGFKIIFSERNYPPEYLLRTHLGWIKKWLMKFTYRKADLVIPNSKLTKIALGKYFNVRSDKLKTIYNPIDLEKVIARSHEEVAHPFFEDKHSQVIISVGRLVSQKRFDRLLRVFSLVKKLNEKARLIIIGEGELRADLCELAVKLNIQESVDFVGYKANPYAWISKADIFVLSSDYEGFPNVLLESMACEIPIISTDCPGPSEIIKNGENGILVRPRDEEGMATAVNALLDNRELREKFAKEGLNRVEEFAIEKILPQYEDLFVSNINS